jgi:cation diffusion facilitator CzcD-associated flavoprotein CzcO
VSLYDVCGCRWLLTACLGAGQGGLTLAARLKQLGVASLLVDRNKRIGDNWRNRYHQLVLHE